MIEILRANRASESNLGFRNGNSVRQLNVQDSTGTWFELDIRSRICVPKASVLQCEPSSQLVGDSAAILRRWLAQRYSRSGFPTAFNNWLTSSKVGEAIEREAKRNSDALVAIYFDLDDDSERTDPGDPYALGIQLVHATTDNSFALRAAQVAKQLSIEFESRCKVRDKWQMIELLYSDAIADTAFTLQAANSFRRWRLEHRSVAGEPIDESQS